jgi:hypothetical protein
MNLPNINLLKGWMQERSLKVNLLVLCVLITLAITDCKKETKEMHYFDEFVFNLYMMVPSFPQENMEIQSNKSFQIISSSITDTALHFLAWHDTLRGKITDSEMAKLINYCKMADVYNVKFSNKVNDSMTCYEVVDFVYSINIKDSINNGSNFLSYTYCFIPKAAIDLKKYADTLLIKYLNNLNQ